MVISSALLKSFLNRRFAFLTCLKNDYSNFKTVIFFLSHTHSHKYTNSAFGSRFSSQSNPHSEDLFLMLRKGKGSTIDSMYRLYLLSRAPQDSIDTIVSKLFISSSVYIRTVKISYSKKDIFHLLCPHPHNNYPYPV